MLTLAGPDRAYPVHISLQLVADIEKSHGSLYQIAEALLNRSLPLSSIVEILKIVYRHAGCQSMEEALNDCILRQSVTGLLTAILLDVLTPVDRLGALTAEAALGEGLLPLSEG